MLMPSFEEIVADQKYLDSRIGMFSRFDSEHDGASWDLGDRATKVTGFGQQSGLDPPSSVYRISLTRWLRALTSGSKGGKKFSRLTT